MVESLSFEYRNQLAMAKEEGVKIKAAVFLRNMNFIEAQRRLFRNIRTMTNKNRGGSTTQVTITDKYGRVAEQNERKNIERLIAKPTEKWHQIEGGSELLKEEFTSKLGKYGEGPDFHKVLIGTFIPPEGSSETTKDFIIACKKVKGSKVKRLVKVLKYKETIYS